ncbi:DUF1611 domain-containing protein [Emcibacter sp.]|uniref:DUF1611 domain-containing protein n=1 Tax=Emcibacter sp. TaxID=1979954 RepID=UPI003A8FDD85
MRNKQDNIEIRAPYLIFVGAESRPDMAKTGRGLVEWRPELCKGQLRLSNDAVDLGLPDLTLELARDIGIKSLVIGTASVGGAIPEEWYEVLLKAIRLGLDIVAGVHTRLCDTPFLREAAENSGVRLVDIRVPPSSIPVGSGRKRSGRRLLTVGTDCAIGKKYTALVLEREMKKNGMNVDFRASGQTGIMIAGQGIPIDAVVADFLSGAAELLSPDNAPDHWDIIEGQGGIFHPGFGAVSYGLLVGSQPDAFVVCHEPGREFISGWEGYRLPTVEQVIERTTAIGSLTNPNIRCVGVSLYTANLSAAQRREAQEDITRRTGLPCIDPLIDGVGRIIEQMNSEFPPVPDQSQVSKAV